MIDHDQVNTKNNVTRSIKSNRAIINPSEAVIEGNGDLLVMYI